MSRCAASPGDWTVISAYISTFSWVLLRSTVVCCLLIRLGPMLFCVLGRQGTF